MTLILTFTTIEWVDVFKEDKYKLIKSESLNYCVKNKGLEIFAYVLMSTHMHLIVASLSKINYIHNNPVEVGLIDTPKDYLFSSAVDYAGDKSPVIVSLLNLHNLDY